VVCRRPSAVAHRHHGAVLQSSVRSPEARVSPQDWPLCGRELEGAGRVTAPDREVRQAGGVRASGHGESRSALGYYCSADNGGNLTVARRELVRFVPIDQHDVRPGP
jgi:hypothetical protein